MKNRYIAAAALAVVSLMNCVSVQAKDDFSENYNYKRALEFWNEDKANAKNWLLREIESSPQNGLAFYRLAALYRLEGDYRKAIETSTQAVNLLKKDPDMFPFAYLERAMEYCLSADTASAMSDLSVGLRLNPKSAELYEAFGTLNLEQQQLFQSKMYLQKAMSMNPTSALAYISMGRLCYATGELDESIIHYNNAIKFAETTPWVYIARAESYIKKGFLGDAAEDALEALAIEKTNAKAMSLVKEISDMSYQLMQIKLKARRMKDSANPLWSELSEKVQAYKEKGEALYDKDASLKAPAKDYMEKFIEKAPAQAEATAPAKAEVNYLDGTLYKKELLTRNSKKVDVKAFVEQSAEAELDLSPAHLTLYGLSVVWQH